MGQNKDCFEDVCAWWNKDAKICAITAMSYAMNLQTASMFVGQKDKFQAAIQQALGQQPGPVQEKFTQPVAPVVPSTRPLKGKKK